MQEIILIKNGEIVLKGLNRGSFEERLVKNIKRRLYGVGPFSVTKAQSTIYITPKDDTFDMDLAVERLQTVFGIASFSRACVVEKELKVIIDSAVEYLRDTLESVKSFKVESKRADKKFPLTSPEISAEVGGALSDAYPHLAVDVHHPDLVVMIEIRDFGAYIHAGAFEGAGGMPAGTSGRAALLISGGIDSPVAGYMLAKRGVELCGVHFASPPYTSERARLKVLDLLKEVSRYSGRIQCFVVPFTKIQEEIRKNCPEELFTIIMRRIMMKCSQRIAEQNECEALITGESIAQVASQTMQAIACTDAAVSLPVYRPLIGMDKEEIIRIARKIGTFETSILPYEDCCTVFTPKHPRTKPKLQYVELAEQSFDFAPLIDQAVQDAEKIVIG